MNKKLLFGIMSLAAMVSCSTNDDFESQKVAQEASPIQFEVLNNNNAFTRASMNGDRVEWSAAKGDLFTLYHGGAGITGYENATYTASAAVDAPAVLTTPSMIKTGLAVMVWPVDTTFRIGPADNLSIEIPADQKADIENYIPYMSDQITIDVYGAYNEDPAKGPVTAWNTEGKDRKYPVYMRPMASQLKIKADYVGTDATLATLYTGDDAIEKIKVESIKLLTNAAGADKFTTNLDVKWTAPTPAINTQWAAVAHNAWTAVTDYDLTAINTQSAYLETECLTKDAEGKVDNKGAKFLILPQTTIAGGVDDGAVVVNTIYGKVFIGDPTVYTTLPNKSYYSATEFNNAWYRYLTTAKAAADAEENASITPAVTSEDPDINGKFKTVAKDLTLGMQQTINGLSTYTHQKAGVVKGEPEGAATTRYVEVRLNRLDMSDLHIKTDKQLRDAARVWDKLGLGAVTVYLDGDANGEFAISKKTIEVINDINEAAGSLDFKVKPCKTAGEACPTIVITGGGDVPNIPFIISNGSSMYKANVALNAGETWNWKGTIKVAEVAATPGTFHINKIINRGTMANAETATLNVENYAGTNFLNVPFENAEGAVWNITGGKLNVQFNVTNYGTVNIAKGAQYRQDGQIGNTIFTNEATALPTRFGGNDAKIGKVVNKGVFATVEKAGTYTAKINNYGLIEHDDIDAKTYITNNQLGGAFGTIFGGGNKMGRINLPFSNKEEDNVSVSAALAQGFVSVTVNGEVSGALDASVVGSKVNYVIVKSGITEIQAVSAQVDYLEINQPGTELAWNVPTATTYQGLMVLSDVNVKLGTTLNVAVATYLGADMYVGGNFTTTKWAGYYGDTSTAVASQYITY